MASIQAATNHEHTAIVTALYLACYSFGSSLGNAVSGAIWTQVLPRELEKQLRNATSAEEWYTSPFGKLTDYPVGTLERAAVIEAFKHVQKLLCITGACLCVLLIVCSCIIRDPELPNKQCIDNAEDDLMEMLRTQTTLEAYISGDPNPPLKRRHSFFKKL